MPTLPVPGKVLVWLNSKDAVDIRKNGIRRVLVILCILYREMADENSLEWELNKECDC